MNASSRVLENDIAMSLKFVSTVLRSPLDYRSERRGSTHDKGRALGLRPSSDVFCMSLGSKSWSSLLEIRSREDVEDRCKGGGDSLYNDSQGNKVSMTD
jgi:hypothetical protein